MLKKSLNTSIKTYKKALHHECISDVVYKNDKVTIIFIPISTSSNKVLCGIQKFDKIHLFTKWFKRFLYYKNIISKNYD